MQRQPIHKSQIINHKSSQAYRFDRAGVDADAAIDAAIRIHFRLAIDHTNRTARALAGASLTTRAFLPIDFRRHFVTLSKTTTITLKSQNDTT